MNNCIIKEYLIKKVNIYSQSIIYYASVIFIVLSISKILPEDKNQQAHEFVGQATSLNGIQIICFYSIYIVLLLISLYKKHLAKIVLLLGKMNDNFIASFFGAAFGFLLFMHIFHNASHDINSMIIHAIKSMICLFSISSILDIIILLSSKKQQE